MNTKEMREKRAKLAKQIRELADKANNESRDFTAEEKQQWEAINADYDQLSRQIERAERAEQIEGEQEQAAEERSNRQPGREDRDGREDRRTDGPTDEDRTLALHAWCRAQYGLDLSERHQEAVQRCGVNPNRPDYDIALRGDYGALRAEMRAQSTALTAGGDTIPRGFVNNFERALLAYGGMREVADVIRTTTGNDLPWPTTNDTGNKGVLLGENTAVAEQDVVTSAITWKAWKYTSRLVRVSQELLEDSAFNFAAVLGEMLGERIGRITNEHFTTGTPGNAQPLGVVTGAALGVTAASATAITSDEVINLIHSVNPSYRQGAGFMMHDNILLAIRKLKDTTGQYLWQPSYQAGVPDRLLGYPVTVNQDMASAMAAAARTIVFGQLSKYKIRDVASFRLRRLVERYADFDQEGFVAFSRHDGRILDAGTNPIKYLRQL
jgi:HK97 family phage major capsid protein